MDVVSEYLWNKIRINVSTGEHLKLYCGSPVLLKNRVTLSIQPFVLLTPYYLLFFPSIFFSGSSYQTLQTFC